MTALDDDGVLPELLPARMLNEFVYCPRLFHLEWVQSQWADNLETDEGRLHHRRVDREQGAAPDPALAQLRRAQSVLLSDADLGVVAQLDVIEGDGGHVRPVDVKRGSPAPVEGGVWDPERIQVAVQVLLLRANGYDAPGGVVYFADSRTRVDVVVDEDVEGEVRQLIAAARASAAGPLPPPLVDSHKCPCCSLVGICLPDEVNELSDRASRPRRLVPSDDAARPLYVNEQGAKIGVRRGRLEIRFRGEQLGSVRLLDVSQLCLHGNVQVTTQAITSLLRRSIPVVYLSYGGWFNGMTSAAPPGNVELRHRQHAAAVARGVEAASAFVRGKIANQRTLLRRNARHDVASTVGQLATLQRQADEAATQASLLGTEGTAARLYFGAFSSMLRGDLNLPGASFSESGRNRRPPRDPVNAVLSYAYALLVKDLVTTCWSVGLDPYVGLFHQPRFGRPALALDLAEEFRALIGDSTVIQVLNNSEVGPTDFVVRARGVQLTKRGRRSVQDAYERRLATEITHPVFKYRVSYRRVMEVQARLLAAWLMGDVEEYRPMTTR